MRNVRCLDQLDTIRTAVNSGYAKHSAPKRLLTILIEFAEKRIRDFDGQEEPSCQAKKKGQDIPYDLSAWSVLDALSVTVQQLGFIRGMFDYSCDELPGFKYAVKCLVEECLSDLEDMISEAEKKNQEADAAA